MNPVYDLIFVAERGTRMRRGLCDQKIRRQTARHGLRQADNVMRAGSRVARRTPLVRRAVTAEKQFLKFGAVCIPLEDHHLPPVVPYWRRNHDVLIDKC
jgi:hypothetical protein